MWEVSNGAENHWTFSRNSYPLELQIPSASVGGISGRQFSTIPPSRKECPFAYLLIPCPKNHLSQFCIRVRSPQPSRPMMSLLMFAWRMPSPNPVHMLGAHWGCGPVVIGAVWQISPLPGREATQQQHLSKIYTESFSLPPFDLLNTAGGTGFASLLLTNRPMNVSHICSQNCPGLNTSAFNVPLFFLPHSITRRNIAQPTDTAMM